MGSRFDAPGRDGSRSADDYNYGSYSGSGMRPSDAAGGYRKSADDASQYSRDSYVGEHARRSRRSDDVEGDQPVRRLSRSSSTPRSFSHRNSAAQPERGEARAEAKPTEQAPAAERRASDRSRLRAEAAARIAEREAAKSRVEPERSSSRAADSDEPPVRAHYSRSSATYATKKSKGRKRAVGIVVGVVLALVLVGAGVAFAYFNGVIGKMNAGLNESARAQLVHTDMANEPFYVLLLGTDRSAERDETGDFNNNYRTDSMMLARIDPVAKKVTMVSIPRDTLVDLGEYGYQKINAAYTYGGPELAIKAVSQLAGVGISHYAEIDFDGFAAMVDALGGVEVDVPVDIDDWEAGGSVSAGLQTLSGDQALILCRSRNTYSTSAAPDLMRAANQRLVLSAVAHKLLAADVGAIASTVNSVADFVTTDLQLNDIIGLAQIMQGLDSANDIYTASFPTTSVYVANGRTYPDQYSTVATGSVDPSVLDGYYLLPDQDTWAKMKKRMEAGEPPSEGNVVDEATGTVLATAGADADDVTEKYCSVVVKNATNIKGVAGQTAEKLGKVGFENVTIGEVTDGGKYPETIVVYNDPSKEYEAGLIVKAMGQGKAMKNDGSYLLDTDFLVIIGDDWKTSDKSGESS